jgi:hypothetical protein
VVILTPEPGAPLSECLAELANELAARRREFDARLDALRRDADARLGAVEQQLNALAAVVSRGPGRPSGENPPNFRQDVQRLKVERGWGRGRIATELGVSPHQARKELKKLEEAAGENLPPGGGSP